MLHTLTGKVTLGALLFMSVLSAIAVGGVRGVSSSQTVIQRLTQVTLVQANLNEALSYRLARTHGEIISAGVLRDPEELEEARESLELARSLIEELRVIEAGRANPAYEQLEAQRLELLSRLAATTGALEASITAGDEAATEAIVETLESFDQAILSLIEAQESLLLESTAKEIAEINQLTKLAVVSIPLQITLIALLAGLGVWLLHRLVVRPVRRLAEVAVAIGAGQLDQPIPRNGIDEVRTLQNALAQMASQLRERDTRMALQIAKTRTALTEVELRSAEQAQLMATMEQQRELIRGLSVPVLPIIKDALVMPLVGTLDRERLQMMREQALHAVERRKARTLLLDVTGVPVLDLEVAEGLLTIFQAVRLLGAELVLVGIRPEVAQTLVSLGADLSGIATRNTLQSGVAYALRRN